MPSRRRLSAGGLLAALSLLLLLSFGLVTIVGSGDSLDRRIVPPDEPSLHPVATEIQSLQETRGARLRSLETRARETEDPQEELAIQREIQQVKVETEIAMYRVQLRHAESRGDEKTAATLRDVLAAYEKMGQRRSGEDPDLPAHEAGGEEVAP